jgi:UDP-N-acetylglucosamine 2-epimerase (non-hydrolysing)
MKKILLCFGTRPEAIKMAPLYHVLKLIPSLDVKICVTGQHREMLDQVFDFFEIIPDFDLDLMKSNQSLNDLSANILLEIDKILILFQPDIVLVHGDTTTSVIVALSAFYRNIKVGHVEAGLRTFNKKAPYPEEINRQITSRIADFHFVPTVLAKQNLLNEGILENLILTGNTIVDALIWANNKLENGYENVEIEKLKFLLDKKIVLVTGHRRESFGLEFENFCKALIEISETENVNIVFPVHLNPNVQEPVFRLLSKQKNIYLLQPVAYPVMVWLLKNATLIISDSGGIQEEAPAFCKPILVTRSVSERPEGIEKGFSILVGTDKEIIVEKANYFLNNPFNNNNENPYGDGFASQKIVDFLLNI